MDHRRKFIGLWGFDYDTLQPATLSLEISTEVVSQWKADFERMCRTMFYGEKPSWDVLMVAMKELQERVRSSV